MSEPTSLRQSALDIFRRTCETIDVEKVVRDFLTIDDTLLRVGPEQLDLSAYRRVLSIGMGKACQAMARTVSTVFGEYLDQGLLATPAIVRDVPVKFEVFLGGHPMPNDDSIRSASRALELLAQSDAEDTLVVFLITGGGSAVFEKPIDESITLDDLRSLNSTLVGCGAVISEINIVRRHLSAVKGGRLAEAAPRARQISLYVSDVNDDDLATVASGPTMPGNATLDDFHRVVEKYSLLGKLPQSIVSLIEAGSIRGLPAPTHNAKRTHHLLLDNRRALYTAKSIAEQEGFVVEVADDLVEAGVAELARAHIDRVLLLKKKHPGRRVCLLSGGEAICPVRGNGRGGRNQEFVLRAMLDLAVQERDDIVVLSAGTDGIDGNSPAAGAFGDNRMRKQAEAMGVTPSEYLEDSDSYTFLERFGGAIVTGPTGNNVRDLRVILCF